MQAEYITRPFVVKADDDTNFVAGYASTFGKTDLDDDVIIPGAFKKTLQERLPKGQIKFLAGHAWNVDGLIGTVREAHEDKHGLFIKAELASTPTAQNTRALMLEGHLDRMSIGFRPIRERWERNEDDNLIRYIDEIMLYEVSAVVFPANEDAIITNVKDRDIFTGTPIAPMDTKWDYDGAVDRIQKWAKATDTPNAKYWRAFLWHDRKNADRFEANNVCICDIIDEKMMVVPQAIFSLGLLAIEGHPLVTEDIKGRLTSWYEKLGVTPAWKETDESWLFAASLRGNDLPQNRITSSIERLLALDGDSRTDILASLSKTAEPGTPLTASESDMQKLHLLEMELQL